MVTLPFPVRSPGLLLQKTPGTSGFPLRLRLQRGVAGVYSPSDSLSYADQSLRRFDVRSWRSLPMELSALVLCPQLPKPLELLVPIPSSPDGALMLRRWVQSCGSAFLKAWCLTTLRRYGLVRLTSRSTILPGASLSLPRSIFPSSSTC